MDYLLDQYLFPYLPMELTEETRKEIGQKALSVVMWADWLLKYQDPMKIYENHTSFLFGELLFFVLASITFYHAYRHGPRYMFVWIGITIHALNVENLCYWIPDMDNFWQAQGIFTLFGMRAPLYILFGIYHWFDYVAYAMVRRLYLPWWAEGPAVGLCAVMLDMPYDIMGIKLVWWTWHDTDPNIYDRMYWVPWNSYYFHASFACSFVWILKASRYFLVDYEYDWKKIPRELLCSFLAGTLAFWVGTIQFALLYHPLHDMFGVHSEITTLLFLGTYALIVIFADRNNKRSIGKTGNKYWFDELTFGIALEYLFYMILVIVSDPFNIVSEGLHQPIGNCDEVQKVQTPTGLVLTKKKYLCTSNYDEKYFDFHCVPNGAPKSLEPGQPLEWYAACGTDYDNRVEYITIIWGICILYGYIFYQIAAYGGPLPIYPEKKYPKLRRSAVESKTTSPASAATKKSPNPLEPHSSKSDPPKSPSKPSEKAQDPLLTRTTHQRSKKIEPLSLIRPPSALSHANGNTLKSSHETPRIRTAQRPAAIRRIVPIDDLVEPTPSRLRARKNVNYKV